LLRTENERVAAIIGINRSARTTTVKPAGTTSLTLGTSSGIHAWHNDYYVFEESVLEKMKQFILI
jgi:ribonucleoside-triphosphate reductase (thioredoxin)